MHEGSLKLMESPLTLHLGKNSQTFTQEIKNIGSVTQLAKVR